MSVVHVSSELAAELYGIAGAAQFDIPSASFDAALQASAARAFANQEPASHDVERYLRSLHLEDMALALACAGGHDGAWDTFITRYRAALYRAADALDPSGRARELADSLYGDLYGVAGRERERQSLLLHYHGRSSLLTWLRAVLAQRHVDSVRASRRTEPLDEDESDCRAAPPAAPDPDRERYLALVLAALRTAIEALTPGDRLRFACYYADGLKLAAIGRIVGEHEASVSRNLSRIRRSLRESVERELRQQAGLDESQIKEALEYAAEDAGTFDLSPLATRKESSGGRSI